MNKSLKDWNIGFIGLGLMGKPMCLNLHEAGANLHVFNRTFSIAAALQRERLQACRSPAEVASKSDFIITMVADTNAVEAVLLGEQGVVSALRKGAIVIDMGTTSVSATRRFAEQVRQQGADYIDAPVSGGEIGAIDGQLSIMAGGIAEALKRAQAVFDVLGKKTVHIGDVGTGQVTKAANQVIVGLNIGAVAEALTLAKRAGADLNRVRDALLGGFAASRILEVHGKRMIDGKFQPGGKILTQHKDLSQAIELAAEYGLDLPATELNRDLYQKLIEEGEGELDHSALVLALDR
jgi:2-hydroxy-3-oxopropionate reductase